MNVLDLVLLAVLAGAAIYGSKIGFIRELTGVIALIGAVILAVHYNDYLTLLTEGWLRTSPLWASFWAFFLTSGLLYATFKFAAKVFYRVAEVQKLGRTDKVGGALAGVLHGWFLGGFALFMLMYLPLPYALEVKMEESLLAVRMASSVPFVYETTAKLHPSEKSFVLKLEDSLTGLPTSVQPGPASKKARRSLTDHERQRINDFLDKVERYFFADSW